MPLIEWSEKLGVQVKELDGHHKKLVQLINELHDSMLARKGNDVLGRIFSELVDYTKTHFAAEEKYFSATRYPDFQSHKKEHDDLSKQVIDLQKEFLSGKVTLSIKIMEFLRDWLKNHILVTDKKYTSHLNARGIT